MTPELRASLQAVYTKLYDTASPRSAAAVLELGNIIAGGNISPGHEAPAEGNGDDDGPPGHGEPRYPFPVLFFKDGSYSLESHKPVKVIVRDYQSAATAKEDGDWYDDMDEDDRADISYEAWLEDNGFATDPHDSTRHYVKVTICSDDGEDGPDTPTIATYELDEDGELSLIDAVPGSGLRMAQMHDEDSDPLDEVIEELVDNGPRVPIAKALASKGFYISGCWSGIFSGPTEGY